MGDGQGIKQTKGIISFDLYMAVRFKNFPKKCGLLFSYMGATIICGDGGGFVEKAERKRRKKIHGEEDG